MVNMSIDEVITENGIMTDELYESHCYNIHLTQMLNLKRSFPPRWDSRFKLIWSLDGALRELIQYSEQTTSVSLGMSLIL